MPVTSDQWKLALNDKTVFVESILDGMTGWLDRYAAKRTIDILEHQEREGMSGSLLEIGIYYGKYFAILVRSAAITGSNVVGLDIFDYVTPKDFHAYFNDKFSPDTLRGLKPFPFAVLEGSSGAIERSALRAALGKDARFISIDGSHEYDDVMWDLRVADEILSPGGVISADDYLNPICIGVTAAIDRFIDMTPGIVPFGYVSNKLFLCRPSWADRYRDVLEKAILADEKDPKSIDYRKNYDGNHRRNIESRYQGFRVLTVRL